MSKLPLRPEFHFTPHQGWINDPLALTYRDGQYHLFYQYVPNSTVWGPNCHWGHATSSDLMSWKEEQIAIAPGEGDDGIWSGSIAVHPETGNGTMFYTSVAIPDFGIGRVRQAFPADDTWNTWTKGDFVVDVPAELDTIAFRDPFVFQDGQKWRMLVGTGLHGGIAAATSFSSNDLAKWQYDGIAAQRAGSETSPVWTGTLWECPQIFKIDGRAVLVTSVWEDDVLHYVAYGVGTYEDGKFSAESWGQLTYGSGYYAPSFFRDKDGAPGLIFWIRGYLDEAAGRASALSIPHRLRLIGNTLVSEPHPDLSTYQGSSDEGTEFRLSPDNAHTLTWDGTEMAALQLTQEGVQHVTINGKAGTLRITVGAEEHQVEHTHGRVTMIIDSPVVELFTSSGAFALGSGLQASQKILVTSTAPVLVRQLSRQT
ncbi:glycoside hydrolase family 32 protein [Arthrobacter sp. EH-1B-1]|uniref:beta-fructofuranosidase n=1 Tax=Arthrobacter vasquezii TaxID=2977629 RepID=A0ABT6CUI1_9MICC|nr:glycoside hydrolase family 32 protein [Arthrobacter vasquezii]MDF9277727.1 glycoside hydrolase family 32 protein [Arthrobacter vasquezii]